MIYKHKIKIKCFLFLCCCFFVLKDFETLIIISVYSLIELLKLEANRQFRRKKICVQTNSFNQRY